MSSTRKASAPSDDGSICPNGVRGSEPVVISPAIDEDCLGIVRAPGVSQRQRKPGSFPKGRPGEVVHKLQFVKDGTLELLHAASSAFRSHQQLLHQKCHHAVPSCSRTVTSVTCSRLRPVAPLAAGPRHRPAASTVPSQTGKARGVAGRPRTDDGRRRIRQPNGGLKSRLGGASADVTVTTRCRLPVTIASIFMGIVRSRECQKSRIDRISTW
jgi:hypothetical protein